ncbi:hypothetical protein HELRODRAFT_158927 [Helobdella robusta]|uniref:THAP-type domain-containing protein n=1 Tax=Helobdella robusta TaxID=6412 RepID=T1ENF0_HELRO|nr:hypothetical protein HELRODRAFT_158927 [Helobdella robusta]ESO12406.1 hypothetical protein HELRODRAFT_158927 [Helobdella robusta]
MVNKCAAYGCKSGYKSNAAIDAENKVSFHCYPVNDPELCAKWNKANPQRDFIPSRHSKMCSLHFRPSDFVDKYSDTNSTRYKNKTSNTSFAFSDPADGEACTIYYMSGAVAHSVLHTTRCDDCKEILVDDESICVDVHHLKEQVFFK